MLDAQVRGWIGEKRRLATELGLTSVSRSRLKWTGHHQLPRKAEQPQQPQSKLAELQERAAALRRPVGLGHHRERRT